MSPDPNALLRRWFAAAAIAAVVVGAAVALAILLPKPPGLVATDRPPTPAASGQQPSETAPSTTAERPPAAQPSPPVPPKPRQLDDSGAVIAWGGSTAGRAVRLELQGVDREKFSGSEFYVSRGDGPIEVLPRGDYAAQLSDPAPGRYRWGAMLDVRGGAEPLRVEPPRGDATGADFIVVGPLPSIARLAQRTLEGAPLPADRRAEGAVRLGVELREDYPDAVLEVEVKAGAAAFDGKELLRAPFRALSADVTFAGAAGRYRWRARVALPGRAPTDWRDADAGPDYDFALFSKPVPPQPSQSQQTPPPRPQPQPSTGPTPSPRSPPQPPTGQTPPPSDPTAPAFAGRPPSATGGTGTGSTGLGGGRSDPLPSHQIEQASFWQIAFMRLLVGLGVIGAALGAIALALRGLRRAVRRS